MVLTRTETATGNQANICKAPIRRPQSKARDSLSTARSNTAAQCGSCSHVHLGISSSNRAVNKNILNLSFATRFNYNNNIFPDRKEIEDKKKWRVCSWTTRSVVDKGWRNCRIANRSILLMLRNSFFIVVSVRDEIEVCRWPSHGNVNTH